MKVSEMIKNLQEFMKENGDMECYCASGTVRDSMTGDFLDERRDCNKILYKPQLSSDLRRFVFLTKVFPDAFSKGIEGVGLHPTQFVV